jgi:hypothetical protein
MQTDRRSKANGRTSASFCCPRNKSYATPERVTSSCREHRPGLKAGLNATLPRSRCPCRVSDVTVSADPCCNKPAASIQCCKCRVGEWRYMAVIVQCHASPATSAERGPWMPVPSGDDWAQELSLALWLGITVSIQKL